MGRVKVGRGLSWDGEETVRVRLGGAGKCMRGGGGALFCSLVGIDAILNGVCDLCVVLCVGDGMRVWSSEWRWR
jgi:hypothetical protein